MNGKINFILEHMLEDAKDIEAFSKKVESLDAFLVDSLVKKAIIMSLLNIGELANKLPDEFVYENPEVPWRAMVGMRNLAAHGYHILNLEIVWDTIQTSIPELIDFIEKYFQSK